MPTIVRCSHLAPAIMVISAEVIMMDPAVDKFGCIKIKRNIAPGTTKSGNRPFKKSDISLLGLQSTLAINSTSEYFASSDG